ncbi:2-oxoglutarate carboxylase large subunit [Anoxybacillus sp. BCO1]|nr:2-oxoglutarate carboxylase large subunit [Anoxybacillus sp. BCO1]
MQRIILKGREPITVRPGELLEPVDFEKLREELYHIVRREVTDYDVLAYALYPKVFVEYARTVEQFGDLSVLDTPTFLYGMRLGEEIEIEIEKGKTLIVKLVSIGQPQADGTRVVYFELNGQPREIVVKDESIKTTVVARVKADRNNPNHIAATMPGTVVKVLVEKRGKSEKR